MLVVFCLYAVVVVFYHFMRYSLTLHPDIQKLECCKMVDSEGVILYESASPASDCHSPTPEGVVMLSSEEGSPASKSDTSDSVIVISSGADGSPGKPAVFTPTKR